MSDSAAKVCECVLQPKSKQLASHRDRLSGPHSMHAWAERRPIVEWTSVYRSQNQNAGRVNDNRNERRLFFARTWPQSPLKGTLATKIRIVS